MTKHRSHLRMLDNAAIGRPVTRRGVSFFPVYMTGVDLPEIATGKEAGLDIQELDNPEVPTLLAHNPTPRPVLVVEGQHFVGGKQNRTVNGTILVDAKSKLEIPVSCLEQGRWGRSREYAHAASFAPRKVRREKEAHVNRSMRMYRSREGDQGAVWGTVSESLADLETPSDTMAAAAMDDVYRRDRRRAKAVEELVGKGPLDGQCGFAVAHGRRMVALELFGAADLLKPHWEALVRSYLLEDVEVGGRPNPKAAFEFIKSLASVPSEAVPGVGLGTDHRIEDSDVVGQMLTLEGSIVHCSAFARDGGRRRPEMLSDHVY